MNSKRLLAVYVCLHVWCCIKATDDFTSAENTAYIKSDLEKAIEEADPENIYKYCRTFDHKTFTQEGWTPFQKAAYLLFKEKDPVMKRKREKVIKELVMRVNPFKRGPMKFPKESDKFEDTALAMVGAYAHPDTIRYIIFYFSDTLEGRRIKQALRRGIHMRPEYRRANKVTWWERIFGIPKTVMDMRILLELVGDDWDFRLKDVWYLH